MNEREMVPVPLALKQQYEMILLAMCMLHLEFATGGSIKVNCHSVARAIARTFPDFKVVDGQILRIFNPMSTVGEEVLIRYQSHPLKPFFARIYPVNHSWLVWKGNEQFILDTWPIGGVPGAAPPVLVYQDNFSLVYEKGILTPGVTEESLREDVDFFHTRFEKVCGEINQIHDSFNSKKAA